MLDDADPQTDLQFRLFFGHRRTNGEHAGAQAFASGLDTGLVSCRGPYESAGTYQGAGGFLH
jgi:hypothetical protein